MAIFSAQSCCDLNIFDIIEIPGGGSVGEFYFKTGTTNHGCWELLASDPGPATFSATTGPYSSCTECRQTSNNECCFSLLNCDDSFTYYGVLTAGTLNVNDYYYLQFTDYPIGCYQVKTLDFNTIVDTIQFVDGPFINCPDCASGASTSYFYNFSSCCSNFEFLLTNIPTTLSFGDIYYIESDSYSGCAEVISATPTSNIFSAITLTPFVDCDTCISGNPCVCEISDFCFDTTFSALTGFNGSYSAVCCYSGNSYYEKDGGGGYVFFDGDKWCLSDTLGGTCYLHGNSPCISVCPDICDEFFIEGSCSTTTTTTNPCIDFDFDGIFDCLITSPPVPTPSPTPTLSPTATPVPTPTPTVCSLNFTFSATSIPDPTTTPTPTPTPTPSPDLPVSGSVTFNLFDETFDCPVTKKLYDCIQNRYYYVNEPLVYNGVDIVTGETFGAFLNGVQSCLTYDSISSNSSNATLGEIFAVYGLGCNTCQPFITTTLPPGCEGVIYNLVIEPYDFATNGNIFFPETSNPGATQGILDPNTFVSNSVNFSLVDSLGNIQTTYFSGLTGNSFVISFSQGSNTAIYSGLPYTFLSVFDTILYSPTLSSGLTLVQSASSIFDLKELVCVSYETIPPQCDCSFYEISWNPLSNTTWNWTNCNTNNPETITLSAKDFNRRLCAKTGTLTSEDFPPTLISECCNLNCISYSGYNSSLFTDSKISYVDCNRNFVSVEIQPNTGITFCAIENSVTIFPNINITITNLGLC